jgi:hypothetical protein
MIRVILFHPCLIEGEATMKTRSATNPIFILGMLFILFTTACAGGIVDEEAFTSALNTAVAGTVTAQALDLQLTKGAEVAVPPTDTPAPTQTSIPDTNTPEPSPTNTPEPTQETTPGETPVFTISGPSVQVSIDTNCRSGPGKVYAWLGALMVGEEAVILAKDPSGVYWYIENPDQEGAYCWIWGFYAVTSGNTAPLPIYTPGPTPTPEPDFSVGYREVENCGGSWQIEFEIDNTGRYVLESVSTFVQDTVTGAKSGDSAKNSFERKTGCAIDQKTGNLEPGEIGFTVSRDLSNDPTGNLVYASVTVCTEDDLYGDCKTREFYFTP